MKNYEDNLVPMPGLALAREDYKTNLQYQRNLKRISRAELAARAGISIRTLQDYEQGQKNINNAKAITVFRIAEVLNVEIKDILEDINT